MEEQPLQCLGLCFPLDEVPGLLHVANSVLYQCASQSQRVGHTADVVMWCPTFRRESAAAAVKHLRGHQPVCRRFSTKAWRMCECTADTVMRATVALVPLCMCIRCWIIWY